MVVIEVPLKGLTINTTMYRPLCKNCQDNAAAINYVINGKTYFRSLCSVCVRKKSKMRPVPPNWIKAGYKKKTRCEQCNFLATNSKLQLRVYHVDGYLSNVNWTNLKTICLNCQAIILDSKLGWKAGDLEADY